MRKNAAAFAAMLIMTASAWAAGPNPIPTGITPTFRVTAAEVHITFTAAGDRNQQLTDLSRSDFLLLRDGAPVDSIVSFRNYNNQPLSVLVLTDVSDSMQPALRMNRLATEWLRQHSDAGTDKLAFLDFGAEVEKEGASFHNRHMTSLFDALMETVPSLRRNDSQHHALILLTDGVDTYSFHGLQDVITIAQRYDVSIYAVTAHPEKKQYYSAEILHKLCEATGGRYYDVRKPDALISAMSDMEQELRSGYEVVFRPDANAGVHRLKIESHDRRAQFYYRSAYFQPPAPRDELAVGQ